MISRRSFLVGSSAMAATVALRRVLGAANAVADAGLTPFGPLNPDPRGLLDLPAGFSYRVISRTGERMHDGLRVPGAHDGMAAFATGRDQVTLICNHELDYQQVTASAFAADAALLKNIPREKYYDPASVGGTTNLVYHRVTGRVEKHFLSLIGTERNCAGGPTPWGSWLTCEESVEKRGDLHTRDHGWVFEVPATATALVDPAPLTALGRFNHEAAAVDPRSGIIYLTEDRDDGLFYRFLPEPPGQAQRGRLQALVLRDWPRADTRNWRVTGTDTLSEGELLAVDWIDLVDIDSPKDDLRVRGHAAGAAMFARGEGMWFGGDTVYFACTSGGHIRAGQIFAHRPGPYAGQAREKETPGTLELLVESRDPRQLENCDNVTVTPWGDLLVCEDALKAANSLVGITSAGELYHFAENAYSDSELAGACFDPGGSTLFVNIYQPGLTLAIDGPFPS